MSDITQTITTLPTAPSRQRPSVFADEMDAYLNAQEDMPGELNNFASQANNLKTECNAAATLADSAASQVAAQSSATIYSSSATYAAGAVVQDPGNDYQHYVSQQGSNSGHTPNSDDGTWWKPLVPSDAYLINALKGSTVFSRTCVLIDALGYPNLMVRIPKFRLEDIDASLGTGIHPAFIVNGVEKDCIYIGKYQASLVDGIACSLPNQDPKTYTNFDQALTYCSNKGPGWHLTSNAEWAAIALWCWKNNTMPHGNNNYGRDASYHYETGRLINSAAVLGSSGTARTATGSGPVTWSHDYTSDGIYDLNGNIWEWVGGMRLDDGEIQVIENNNAADNTIDQSSTSSSWKAILASDGSLVAPGTSGTLKYDALNSDGSGGIQIDDVVDNQSDGTTYASNIFETIAADSGITVPNILKQLALAPAVSGLGSDNMWMRNLDERLPLRGGSWHDGTNAGVFALDLTYARSYSFSSIGFRPAFVG